MITIPYAYLFSAANLLAVVAILVISKMWGMRMEMKLLKIERRRSRKFAKEVNSILEDIRMRGCNSCAHKEGCPLNAPGECYVSCPFYRDFTAKNGGENPCT